MQACITHRIIAHPKKTHITHNVAACHQQQQQQQLKKLGMYHYLLPRPV
jgi:hypothetical protein